MAQHHIFVFATINNPYPPMLVDDQGGYARTDQDDRNLITPLLEGDLIFWTKAANVESIDEITFNSHSENFVMHQNSIENGGSQYAEIIGPIPEEGLLIEYSITYTVRGESLTHTQDPKIRLRPTIGS
jgi:hypothetical protein